MATSAGSCSRLVRPHTRRVAAHPARVLRADGARPVREPASFERVTGAKSEWRLMVTSRRSSVAAALALAARDDSDRNPPLLSCRMLTLGLIDVIGRPRAYPPVYLMDTAVELPLAAPWMLSERERRCAKSES
jgi:hypothetical protein